MINILQLWIIPTYNGKDYYKQDQLLHLQLHRAEHKEMLKIKVERENGESSFTGIAPVWTECKYRCTYWKVIIISTVTDHSKMVDYIIFRIGI